MLEFGEDGWVAVARFLLLLLLLLLQLQSLLLQSAFESLFDACSHRRATVVTTTRTVEVASALTMTTHVSSPAG